MTKPNDPSAFLRDMLGQWEKFAGGVGGDMLRSDGLAQGLAGATGAAASAQAGLTQIMQRALAAANMPSRAELEDLSARIGRIEASLFRIESMLTEDRAAAPRPSPARDRTPPETPSDA